MKKIYRLRILKRKRAYLFALAICTASIFQSCAELDPDPLAFNVPQESFDSVEALERGIAGAYSNYRTSNNLNFTNVFAWGGDDMTTYTTGNKGDFRQADQRNVDNLNSRMSDSWKGLIGVINTVNAVLERSEGMESLGINEDRLNRLLGELYFLRAISFHQLTRIFGEVPISLTAIPDPNIGVSSVQEVYQQIESDLLEAEAKLPAIYPGQEEGAPRPNNGSARALLARLYMDWAGFPVKDASKYADAASSAKMVIDNKGNHGFELLEDLEDLWKLENRFNKETIFTVSFCNSCGFANLKYGAVGYFADENLNLNGWQETFGEIKFYEDFPEGARKEATYRTDIPWQTTTDQKSPLFKKITGPTGEIPSTVFLTDRNDFLMRYAEVLLIYAEASGRSGNETPEAWEALNMIRRRANGLPFITADASVDVTTGDLAELAFTERKWEFAGEWLRWSDLVRMERVQEALSDRTPAGSIQEHNAIIGSLGTDNYFAPIPQSATAINPNLLN